MERRRNVPPVLFSRGACIFFRFVEQYSTDNAKEWEEWILFILKGVESTAEDTITLVKSIGSMMDDYKRILRPAFGKKYSHDLINGLFYHPYTKIEHVERNLQLSRQTASKYLNKIVSLGLLHKEKIGKENYYINTRLMDLFVSFGEFDPLVSTESIESVHVKEIEKK